MLRKRALLTSVIFSLVLSACGGGSGSGDDIAGNPGSGDAYASGTTVAPDPGGKPSTPSEKPPEKPPEHMTADPTQARFNTPRGIELDKDGNLYVADTGNYIIRKIAKTGVVTTLAGIAGSPGSEDGTGNAARFTEPTDLTVDHDGNVYVADSFVVRKITPDGTVKTIAGTQGEWGYVNATGADARFGDLRGIAIDKESNIYVADAAKIRKITPDGVVTKLAGGDEGSGVMIDGVGDAAGFDWPTGLTIDRHGRLYVTDVSIVTAGNIGAYSTLVRRVDTHSGEVVTIAGNFGLAIDPGPTYQGPIAQFSAGTGIAVDHDGNIFIADGFGKGRVQRIAPDGHISTIIETGNELDDIAVDWRGNLFVSSKAHTIDKITPAAELSTYAGKLGEAGYADTPGVCLPGYTDSGATAERN